jgi:2-methylcitrate dehydratase PrpD
MKAEEKIIDFVCNRRFEDLPKSALETIKNQFLAITGTTLAGATEDGCEQAVRFYRMLGGKEEATILVHGGKIPAHDAAFVNAAMARALDFCDAIAPGPHIGAALIPASLALSELVGGGQWPGFSCIPCHWR